MQSQTFLYVFLSIVLEWSSTSSVALYGVLQGYDVVEPEGWDVEHFPLIDHRVDGRDVTEPLVASLLQVAPINGAMAIRRVGWVGDDA